jgi:peroxiredoxin
MKYFNTLALTLVSAFAIMSFTHNSTGYSPGDEAIDFKLKSIDSKLVSLADYSDAKGFIVVFTCNHCPFAKMYEDRIIALDKKYKSLGYPVIAINPNDSVSYPDDSWTKMVKRAKEKGFTFPYLLDETQDIAKTYGAIKTPHIYLLHKEDSKLIVKYTGAIDDNHEYPEKVETKYLENALEELISGKEITMKSTKAVGCGIKWKKK